ncbi:MAG: hypothetical protein SGJ24_18905 [Chloroflexota bacterium]|nr:hypothetical protein [Chloroflexota bacterium]
MSVIKRRIVTLALIALSVIAVPSVSANILLVNTTTDEDGTGTACALREAVQAADTDSAYGGCSAGSGSDTIVLPDAAYNLTLGSQLVVDSTIFIQPQVSAAIVRAAAIPNTVDRRVFFVSTGAALTLTSLNISNGGRLVWADSGGCIYVQGALTLNTVAVQQCRAGFEGGGIFVDNGSLTLNNATLLQNVAGDDGGGMRLLASTLSMTHSTVTANTANGVFSTATLGGGIAFEGTSLTISASTISSNTASDIDGGAALGGGLAVRLIPGSATGSITGSRIESNSISGSGTNQGGALYKFGDGTLTINSTCIVENTSPALSNLQPSIAIDATGNWWGTVWGPRILSATGGSGSVVSTGDSIASTGFTSIVVDGTPPLDYGTSSGMPIPTGDWLVTASGCQVCSPVSSVSPGARTCV